MPRTPPPLPCPRRSAPARRACPRLGPIAAALGPLLLGACTSEPSTPPGTATPTGTTPDVDYLAEERLAEVAATLSSAEMAGRDEGTPGHEAARAYIIERLTACGVEPAGTAGFEQPITTGIGVNVVGRVAGSDPSLAARHLVLGAHYDHLGTSGGDIYYGAGDNAAAVAMLIGVGCELAEAPPARSVIIASWDSEEPPTYLTDEMGSEFWAANPTVPFDSIDVAIALDLVGLDLWPGFQGHVVAGAEMSPEVTAVVDATPVPTGLLASRAGLHLVQNMVTGGTMKWSDYAAFLDRGRPILFFSDGTNKHYHEPTDTFDTLDLHKMAREARYLHDVVRGLAAMAGAPSFDGSRVDSTRDTATVVQMVGLAMVAGTGIVDTLGLSTTSQADIESDHAAALAAQAALEANGSLTSSETTDLRRAVQRLMCLAGTMYSESMCHMM